MLRIFRSSHHLSTRLLVKDLRHALVAMHDDLRPTQRRLDRLLRPEDLRQLLQGASPRLDVKEVDEAEFENVPEDEEEVVLSLDVSIVFTEVEQYREGHYLPSTPPP